MPRQLLVLAVAAVLAVATSAGAQTTGDDSPPVGVESPPVDQLPEEKPDELECSTFTYQENAQAYYQRDPVGPPSLDRDSDGVACEELPSAPFFQLAATGSSIPLGMVFALGTLLIVGCEAARRYVR